MKKFFVFSILVAAVVSVVISFQLSSTPSTVSSNEASRLTTTEEQRSEFIEFAPMEFKAKAPVAK